MTAPGGSSYSEDMSNTPTRVFKYDTEIRAAVEQFRAIAAEGTGRCQEVEAAYIHADEAVFEDEGTTKDKLMAIIVEYGSPHQRPASNMKRAHMATLAAKLRGKADAKEDPVHIAWTEVRNGAQREAWILEGIARAYDKAYVQRADAEGKLTSGSPIDSWLMESMYQAAKSERYAELCRDIMSLFVERGDLTLRDAVRVMKARTRPRMSNSSGRGHVAGHDASTEAEIEFIQGDDVGWF